MRLEARTNIPLGFMLLAPVLAVLASFMLCAGLVAWSGVPVLEAYGLLLQGALGSGFALAETLARTTPLIFTGLAAAVAFKSRFWNIGAEGQLYAGALIITVLGTGMLDLPQELMIPVLVICSAVAGALLLLGPVLLKLHFGVDEVVTTLLLNFIVILLVSLLLEGPLKDPMGLGWPQAEPVTEAAELPRLFRGLRLHSGLLLALLLAFIIWIVSIRTTLGYEMRAVGFNQKAARFAGMPVNRVMIMTALISGGIAGIAGYSEVAGMKGNLTLDLSPGFGYTGIVVAMLAQLHPLGVVISATFVASVFVGADAMSRSAGVPSYIADVMVSVSLLCMLVSVLLVRFRIRWS
ncbi:MAG: ABC transporter permease [SAR324 cluster bacterium]|nr:ABC transporter permease [SAR324 cluster bacterium]MBL7034492.1 ABC transporter permease [SAR324 cluster bacterium]